MTMLTKIGNSQGIRIPKPIIKQAKLENIEIEFKVVKDGLLLVPIRKKARKNWDVNILEVLAKNHNIIDEAVADNFLNDSDLDDWEW